MMLWKFKQLAQVNNTIKYFSKPKKISKSICMNKKFTSNEYHRSHIIQNVNVLPRFRYKKASYQIERLALENEVFFKEREGQNWKELFA